MSARTEDRDPVLRPLEGGPGGGPALPGRGAPARLPEIDPEARLRKLRGSLGSSPRRPVLERFSIRKGAPVVKDGWRALELHPLLAPLVYAVQRVRYSRAGRILLLTAVLTPCLVMASLMLAGFDEVKRVLEKAQTEHTAYMSRPDTIVLVLGTDDIPTRASRAKPGRSDTMMLVNIQYDKQKIRVLSIPRDTFVMVDYGRGARGDKIAHAFRRGGLSKSLEAVRRLTRLRIDHYVTIDYGLFREFIDEIGGVDIEIEKKMFYEDRAGGLKIDFEPGVQVLTGQKALEYVRFRKDGRGDMGRIERQQKFLRALVRKLLDVRQLKRLLNEETMGRFLAHLDTDFVPSQLLPLGYQFFGAEPDAFEARVLPGSHAFRETDWTAGRRLSYFFPDWEATDGLLDGWFLSEVRDPATTRVDAQRDADRALQRQILESTSAAEGEEAGEPDEDQAEDVGEDDGDP